MVTAWPAHRSAIAMLHTSSGSQGAIHPRPYYHPWDLLFRKAPQRVSTPSQKALRWILDNEPSHEVLQQLYNFERFSPNFPNQLISILSTRQYQDLHYSADFQRKDGEWLIEYLDNVCVRVPLYHSLLSVHRSSTLFTLLALRIVNAYVNSKGHAFIGMGYRGPTCLMFPPCSPLLIKPLLDRIKPSMKGR